MDEVIIRKACEKDMPQVLKLLTAIFCGEQGIPEDAVDEFTHSEYTCWCAECEGQICACVSAWYEGEELHWGRFAVLPQLRGRGIGRTIAKESFEEIFSSGTDIIFMEARDVTVKLVCGMGGRVSGELFRFFDGNVTPVILTRDDYRP